MHVQTRTLLQIHDDDDEVVLDLTLQPSGKILAGTVVQTIEWFGGETAAAGGWHEGGWCRGSVPLADLPAELLATLRSSVYETFGDVIAAQVSAATDKMTPPEEESSMARNPNVEVGQIWADNDERTRDAGEFEIIAIEGDKAVVKRSTRTTKISLKRFRNSHRNGFRYVGRGR